MQNIDHSQAPILTPSFILENNNNYTHPYITNTFNISIKNKMFLYPYSFCCLDASANKPIIFGLNHQRCIRTKTEH